MAEAPAADRPRRSPTAMREAAAGDLERADLSDGACRRSMPSQIAEGDGASWRRVRYGCDLCRSPNRAADARKQFRDRFPADRIPQVGRDRRRAVRARTAARGSAGAAPSARLPPPRHRPAGSDRDRACAARWRSGRSRPRSCSMASSASSRRARRQRRVADDGGVQEHRLRAGHADRDGVVVARDGEVVRSSARSAETA